MAFARPDIHCDVATLGPRQLSHKMYFYKDRSSISDYALGNWFTKLFHSALPLAKKYILPTAADLLSSTIQDLGCGKD